jgi:hypothetical protein
MMTRVDSLTRVRARQALTMAQALSQRVQFRTVDGRETGDLWGHPDVLRALCAYVGVRRRDCSRWSVWLEEKYRARIKTIRGNAPSIVAREVH